MRHANIVRNVITEPKEVLQQEQVLTENPTIIPEPINHVANEVQIIQQQLATDLHHMQSTMQAIHMQYSEAPEHTHQDYGGREYHSRHTNHHGQGGCGAQHRGNWQGVQGGQGNSYLTHYCWDHIICAHSRKYCMTPS